MLRSLESLRGYGIAAADGDIGKISDFYFDDVRWTVRYMVIDTGTWLPGRQVLISPLAFEQPDWSRAQVRTPLTKAQIRQSPDIASDQPVSQQFEEELRRYYGWPPYWSGEAMITAPPTVTPESVVRAERAATSVEERRGNPHLQSAKEVTGYRIHATDGDIGHVEDFIADDTQWVIRYLVVDTRNWLPGRRVLIAPQQAQEIRWLDRTVSVNLSKAKIQGSPEFHPGDPVNRDYEGRLYDYYGWPTYWESNIII